MLNTSSNRYSISSSPWRAQNSITPSVMNFRKLRLKMARRRVFGRSERCVISSSDTYFLEILSELRISHPSKSSLSSFASYPEAKSATTLSISLSCDMVFLYCNRSFLKSRMVFFGFRTFLLFFADFIESAKVPSPSESKRPNPS